MTGFVVDGPQLLAHGEGSARQSENFTGLERLLEQARVSDDCFGPLFFYFKDKYYDSLLECQGMAKQAAAYLTHISDTVKQTAEAYGATEANNATGLANVDKGTGTLSDLNNAGNDTRKGYWGQTSAYGSSAAKAWMDVTDQVKDPGSPPEAAFATFNGRMEVLKTVAAPSQALVDNLLGFLISLVFSPIVNWVLEPALGDPEQMRSTADGWEKVAEWLNTIADHEDNRTAATAAIWEGEAAEKFRAEMTEFGNGARAMSGDISNIKGLLETAATIFDTFVEVCVDILQEFVLGLIIEWLAALAASWITAGASTAAASAATGVESAVTAGRLATKVEDLRKKLKRVFEQLEKILVSLRNGKLSEIAEHIPGGGKTFVQSVTKHIPDSKTIPQVVDKLRDLRQVPGIKNTVTGNPVTGILSQTGNAKKAQKGIKDAQRGLAAARRSGDPQKLENAKETMEKARKNLKGLDARNTRSSNNYIGDDAKDSEALAQSAMKIGLGYLAGGGTTDEIKAVFRGVLENVPGAAVEWGAGQVYDKGQDPSTAEERKAAQQRGFSTDDGTGKNP